MEFLKIGENKNADGINSAQYYISYEGKANKETLRKRSFEILTKLKGDRDVLIELKSSLLCMQQNKREETSIRFLKSVKDMGLNFRSRKSAAPQSASGLAKLFSFGASPKDSYEIITHVTSETWNSTAFREIIPDGGIMYYICKETSEPQKVMEDLFNGQIFDEDKRDLFDFQIYDCIDFAQMGVFSESLGADELEKIVKGG